MSLPLLAFTLKKHVLFRTGTVAKAEVTQVVIPRSLIEIVLKHDIPQAGHPGRDRTLIMTCVKYYWATMHLDIERHVAHCLFCAETKDK